MTRLFSELRRRHVFRVAAAYAVVAWLLIQVAATTFPAFGAPDWVLRTVIAVALLGFPVALVLAWAFELTPAGVRRADPLAAPAPAAATPASDRRPFDRRAAGLLGLGALVGLTTVGAYGWMSAPGLDDAERGALSRSLAVLPFASVGAGPEGGYFSEGISEELLNALAQVEGVRVVARTSSFTFANSTAPLDSIARALGVRHLLEGTVRTGEGRVRITARLVDAATGHPVWSHSYDREAVGILALQEEIAVAIANALEAELSSDGTARLRRSRSVDPEAYELYLQGRHLAGRRTPVDLEAAIGRFDAALARDPAFAAAYAGLADAYALLEDYRGLPREEAYPKSIAAARRALELDERQPEAHASLGHIYYHQEDWAASEREFRRAIALNPSYAAAHHWYGNLLVKMGRLPEAVQALDRAHHLDPLSPKIQQVRGHILHWARELDRAIGFFEELQRAHPGDETWAYSLGWAYMCAGRHDEAIETLRRMVDRIPPGRSQAWATSRLAAAYAAAGRRPEALELIAELERAPEGANPSALGVAYGFIGGFDDAFRWLALAVDQDHWMVRSYAFDPAYDPLRSDPRFDALLRRARQRELGAGL